MGNITETKRSVVLRILNARLIEDGRVIGAPLSFGQDAIDGEFSCREVALHVVETVRAELLRRAMEAWRLYLKPESDYTVDLTYKMED